MLFLLFLDNVNNFFYISRLSWLFCKYGYCLFNYFFIIFVVCSFFWYWYFSNDFFGFCIWIICVNCFFLWFGWSVFWECLKIEFLRIFLFDGIVWCCFSVFKMEVIFCFGFWIWCKFCRSWVFWWCWGVFGEFFNIFLLFVLVSWLLWLLKREGSEIFWCVLGNFKFKIFFDWIFCDFKELDDLFNLKVDFFK